MGSTIEAKAIVLVYSNRAMLGAAAGIGIVSATPQLLRSQGRLRMIFAAAPSQNEFLDALGETEEIDWLRVVAFQTDECLGLAAAAPQSFGSCLRGRLSDRDHPGAAHLIEPSQDSDIEGERYARLITAPPIDVVCLRIGENGRLAFNDPPVADFGDREVVKRVQLDPASLRQQVNNGCFQALEPIPAEALTLTIPALLAGSQFTSFLAPPRRTRSHVACLVGSRPNARPRSFGRIQIARSPWASLPPVRSPKRDRPAARCSLFEASPTKPQARDCDGAHSIRHCWRSASAHRVAD